MNDDSKPEGTEQEPQFRVRPESILARNFSEDLDSLFGLNSGSTLGHLSENVLAKKRNVSTQEQELAELEERIRAAEERLANASGSSSAASSPEEKTAEQAAAGSSAATPRPESASSGSAYKPPSRTASRITSAASASASGGGYRPQNPREDSFTPHMPGGMPRTPTPRYGAGNDYVTVDRTR